MCVVATSSAGQNGTVTDPEQLGVAEEIAAGLGGRIVRELGGRQRRNWLLARGDLTLVLRRHANPTGLDRNQQLASIAWEQQAQRALIDQGWPAARPAQEPWFEDGAWWTVESALPGQPKSLSPREHAALWAQWEHTATRLDLAPRPGPWQPLAVLQRADAHTTFACCEDMTDRALLVRRHEQALQLAELIDWSASQTVLVHGDLTSWNLHWDGATLAGLLDLELAHHDRRTVEAVHIWRCRYDQTLLEFHRLRPLNVHEWRMVLLDWWGTLLSQACVALSAGEQPGGWTLDGLRRETELSRGIVTSSVPST